MTFKGRRRLRRASLSTDGTFTTEKNMSIEAMSMMDPACDPADESDIIYQVAKPDQTRSEETTFGRLKRRASFGGSSALQVGYNDEQIPVQKESTFGKLRRRASLSGLGTFNNDDDDGSRIFSELKKRASFNGLDALDIIGNEQDVPTQTKPTFLQRRASFAGLGTFNNEDDDSEKSGTNLITRMRQRGSIKFGLASGQKAEKRCSIKQFMLSPSPTSGKQMVRWSLNSNESNHSGLYFDGSDEETSMYLEDEDENVEKSSPQKTQKPPTPLVSLSGLASNDYSSAEEDETPQKHSPQKDTREKPTRLLSIGDLADIDYSSTEEEEEEEEEKEPPKKPITQENTQKKPSPLLSMDDLADIDYSSSEESEYSEHEITDNAWRIPKPGIMNSAWRISKTEEKPPEESIHVKSSPTRVQNIDQAMDHSSSDLYNQSPPTATNLTGEWGAISRVLLATAPQYPNRRASLQRNRSLESLMRPTGSTLSSNDPSHESSKPQEQADGGKSGSAEGLLEPNERLLEPNVAESDEQSPGSHKLVSKKKPRKRAKKAKSAMNADKSSSNSSGTDGASKKQNSKSRTDKADLKEKRKKKTKSSRSRSQSIDKSDHSLPENSKRKKKGKVSNASQSRSRSGSLDVAPSKRTEKTPPNKHQEADKAGKDIAAILTSSREKFQKMKSVQRSKSDELSSMATAVLERGNRSSKSVERSFPSRKRFSREQHLPARIDFAGRVSVYSNPSSAKTQRNGTNSENKIHSTCDGGLDSSRSFAKQDLSRQEGQIECPNRSPNDSPSQSTNILHQKLLEAENLIKEQQEKMRHQEEEMKRLQNEYRKQRQNVYMEELEKLKSITKARSMEAELNSKIAEMEERLKDKDKLVAEQHERCNRMEDEMRKQSWALKEVPKLHDRIWNLEKEKKELTLIVDKLQIEKLYDTRASESSKGSFVQDGMMEVSMERADRGDIASILDDVDDISYSRPGMFGLLFGKDPSIFTA